MKKLILLIFLFTQSYWGIGQLLRSKESKITFFSEALLENITATSTKAKAVVDIEHKEIAVKINMTSFEFPNKLMQEHFNENYLESDKYPQATFTGNLTRVLNWSTPFNTTASISGVLTIHGVSKMEIIEGKIINDPNRNTVIFESSFPITVKDFNIKVPTLVFTKIAEVVNVKIYVKLEAVSTINKTENTKKTSFISKI
ncbi:MAG: YceI family protein [Spirosomataceae bacterium]